MDTTSESKHLQAFLSCLQSSPELNSCFPFPVSNTSEAGDQFSTNKPNSIPSVISSMPFLDSSMEFPSMVTYPHSLSIPLPLSETSDELKRDDAMVRPQHSHARAAPNNSRMVPSNHNLLGVVDNSSGVTNDPWAGPLFSPMLLQPSDSNSYFTRDNINGSSDLRAQCGYVEGDDELGLSASSPVETLGSLSHTHGHLGIERDGHGHGHSDRTQNSSPFSHGSPGRGSSSGDDNSGVDIHPSKIQELLHEQELKKRRLARKAELARASRRKKKTRIEELEQEVAGLKNELETMRKRRKDSSHSNTHTTEKETAGNGNGSSSSSSSGVSGGVSIPTNTAIDRTLHELIRATRQGVNGKVNEQQQQRYLTNLTETLVQQIKEKRTSTEKLLGTITQAAVPGTSAQFLQWLLTQSDKFYQDPAGLWTSLLVHEVGATPQQLKAIAALRLPPIQPPSTAGRDLSSLAELCNQFQLAVSQQLEQTERAMERVTSILSGVQMGKLLAWVQQFGGVCIKIKV